VRNKVVIIAEAGVNHNGNISEAMKLVEAAAWAGADYVKFQTFKSDQLASSLAHKAPYQVKSTGNSLSQLEMLSKLELSEKAYLELKSFANLKKIGFLTSGFDLDSLDLIKNLDLDKIKIPSGEITNLQYLRKVAEIGKPVLLSTGMSNLSEVESAIFCLEETGLKRNKITLLHCTTNYPAEIRDVNLLAMSTLGSSFKLQFGYSDHTLGVEVPIAAVAMGARVIEKHLTLNKRSVGPDHMASLEPDEFRNMVGAIRNIELAFGDGIKRPTKREKINLKAVRKSIVAKTSIQAGEVFSELNITVKRPAGGISPMDWDAVVGQIARRNYDKDEQIDK
jgi:N,N'-diacetyllegionaminate synthase